MTQHFFVRRKGAALLTSGLRAIYIYFNEIYFIDWTIGKKGGTYAGTV